MVENKNKNLIALAIIVGSLIIAGAIVLATMIYLKGIKPEGIKPEEKTELPPEEETIPGISIEDESILGSSDAPIILIEFSDFQCPFCARYANDTFLQVKKEYVDTGQVKVVFKHFPLPFHTKAQKAAEAAECAGEQEKFWEYKENLFLNQENLKIDDLKNYARDLGLDTEKFNNCLDSGKFSQEVEEDVKEGKDAGVTGTPTFFINGEKLVGAQPFSEFQKIIEEELK